ncbi:MAG: polyphosphate kinase 2 [Chitinophagales bacterium]|jgi:polyphosphate kinase 2|nr:polyphosphate kinase 2 [Chitinophagales bacterium]
MFTSEDFKMAKSGQDLIDIAALKNYCLDDFLKYIQYEEQLLDLQTELVKLQHYIIKNKLRLAILFEGRDAAGKGGTIKRFVEHLNPRHYRVVALNKPTDIERGQWYFRRYIKELPNPGEICFFDRSWYNRAVVEPVMGFCTNAQYQTYMMQVTEFEHMLYEDGVILVKFWFSVSKETQKQRFEERLLNPLKMWKYSPVDMKSQELWDSYTYYKNAMFAATHSQFSPWIVVKSNNKKKARLESIKYVLNRVPYQENLNLKPIIPDPNIVFRYYRQIQQND